MESSVMPRSTHSKRRRRNKKRSSQFSKFSSVSSDSVNGETSCQITSKKFKSENPANSAESTNDSDTLSVFQISNARNGQKSINGGNVSLTDLLKNLKTIALEIQERYQDEIKDDPTKVSEIADALQAMSDIQQATKLQTIAVHDVEKSRSLLKLADNIIEDDVEKVQLTELDKFGKHDVSTNLHNDETTSVVALKSADNIIVQNGTEKIMSTDQKNIHVGSALVPESVSVTVSQSNGYSQYITEVNSLLKLADNIIEDDLEKVQLTELDKFGKHDVSTNLHNDETTSVVAVTDVIRMETSMFQDEALENSDEKNIYKAGPEPSNKINIQIESAIKKKEDEAKPNDTENSHTTEDLTHKHYTAKISGSIQTNVKKSNETNVLQQIEFQKILNEKSDESVKTTLKDKDNASEQSNRKQTQSTHKEVNKLVEIIATKNESRNVNSMQSKNLALCEGSTNLYNDAATSGNTISGVKTIESIIVQDTKPQKITDEIIVSQENKIEKIKELRMSSDSNKSRIIPKTSINESEVTKKKSEKMHSIQTKHVCKCECASILHNEATTSGAKLMDTDAVNSKVAREMQLQEIIGMIIEESQESVKNQNNIPQIGEVVEQIVKQFNLQNGSISLRSNSVQFTEEEANCVLCNPQPGPSTKSDKVGSQMICKRNHGTTGAVAKHNDNYNTERTEKASDLYQKLMELEEQELIPNVEAFTCGVCLNDCEAGEGVMLHRCLHTYCRECLANLIKTSEYAQVKCPYRSDEDMTPCNEDVLDSEIRMLISEEDYEKHLNLGLRLAETAMQDAFHCLTPGCSAWCVRVTDSTEFVCPCCCKVNCLRCMYQDGLDQQSDVAKSRDEKKSNDKIDEMLAAGEAMRCSNCKIVVMKDELTCDWIQCTACRTELCWATKGPRWGPKGIGDTSGGCRCKVGGIRCHPSCTHCH